MLVHVNIAAEAELQGNDQLFDSKQVSGRDERKDKSDQGGRERQG